MKSLCVITIRLNTLTDVPYQMTLGGAFVYICERNRVKEFVYIMRSVYMRYNGVAVYSLSPLNYFRLGLSYFVHPQILELCEVSSILTLYIWTDIHTDWEIPIYPKIVCKGYKHPKYHNCKLLFMVWNCTLLTHYLVKKVLLELASLYTSQARFYSLYTFCVLP